jgi:primosomal protein DnaI
VEPIQNSFKKLAKNNDFLKRYEQLKTEIYNDPYVVDFINDNRPEITGQVVEASMGKLYEFMEQSKSCEGCGSVKTCKNLLKGYKPFLNLERNYIDVRYEKCEKKIEEEERQEHASLFQSMFIPKELLDASISNFYHNKGRLNALQQTAEFMKNYQEGEFTKGLYFYGPFGTGKTYLLAAIANELAKKGIKSMLIYMPEFMREVKNSLQDQSINRKIDYIKKMPILMFDDIGAESMSSWFRDEILGTILQYRMSERLPILFSSNLGYSELEHHLTYSQRGEVEAMKAARIMERIKYLTNPVQLEGKNYRNG